MHAPTAERAAKCTLKEKLLGHKRLPFDVIDEGAVLGDERVEGVCREIRDPGFGGSRVFLRCELDS